MNPFKQFTESQARSKVVVVMEGYDQGLAANVVWLTQGVEPEKLAVEEFLLNQRYPKIGNFMLCLESGRIDRAYDNYKKWSGKNLPAVFVDYRSKVYGPSVAMEANEAIRLLSQKTATNMHKIRKIVEMAVSKLPGWQAKVVIQPKFPEEEAWQEPVEQAIVEVFTPPTAATLGCALLPGGLRLWENNNPDLEVDRELKAHYEDLIREISKPDNPRRRLMTVYFHGTPRERSLYREARRTLSLFGNAEICPPTMSETVDNETYKDDVWKARVDSCYLVETQPGHYEVVGQTEIPIRYLELIREGM